MIRIGAVQLSPKCGVDSTRAQTLSRRLFCSAPRQSATTNVVASVFALGAKGKAVAKVDRLAPLEPRQQTTMASRRIDDSRAAANLVQREDLGEGTFAAIPAELAGSAEKPAAFHRLQQR
jgi:hypothetical protein